MSIRISFNQSNLLRFKSAVSVRYRYSSCPLVMENNFLYDNQTRSYSNTCVHLSKVDVQPTLIDLIKTLPVGSKKLYYDYQTYKNIRDASKTKINAWCKLEHHIPRRQKEQQKKFLLDVKKVAVPVALMSIPMIGNFFAIFVAVDPRFFLSDQFFTEEQVRYFVSKEYNERKVYFSSCAIDVEELFSITISASKPGGTVGSMDNSKYITGSVIENVMPLYSLFQDQYSAKKKGTHQNDAQLSRNNILNIAFSSWLASPILWVQPSKLIKRKLDALAKDIIEDDIMLIHEKHHLNSCSLLTSSEVLDACSKRSLPCAIDQSVDAMRESLTSHLLIMEKILDKVGHAGLQSKEAEHFVLYLPTIQHELEKFEAIRTAK